MKHLEDYIKEIFKKIDIQKNNKVTLEQFNQVVSKEPNLLEVFDVLNKGLTHSIDQDHKTLKHKVLANHLTHISSQIDMLLMDLQGHNISLKKMKTNEQQQHSNSPSVKESKKKSPKKKINLQKFKSSTERPAMNSNPDIRNISTKPNNDHNGFSPSFSDYKDPITFNMEEEEFFLRDENIFEEFKCSNSMRKPIRKQKSKAAATMIVESPSHKTKMHKEFFNEDVTEQRKLKRSLTPNQFSQIDEKKSDEEEEHEQENNDVDKLSGSRINENSVVIDSFHSKTVKIIRRLKEIKESVKSAQYCLDDLYEKDNVKHEENNEVIEEFRF